MLDINCGIYEIKNKVNGKRYVGSSGTLTERFRQHLKSLTLNRHCNSKLQHAWNKYGASSFEVNVLIYCAVQDLMRYEQMFIDGLDAVKNGYNILPSAGSMRGHHWKLSQKTKDRMSKACKKRVFTKQWRLNLSLSHKGKKISREALIKRSATMMGHAPYGKHTKKSRKAAADKQRGKTHSEETKHKLSVMFSGSKHPFFGKHHSLAARLRMSRKHKGKKVSVETRKKMSLAQLARQSKQRVA